MKRALVLLAASLLLLATACRGIPDISTPEGAATAVWANRYPAFPTQAELRQLFAPEVADRYARLLRAGAEALAERKDRYEILSTHIIQEGYFDIEPGFLHAPAQFATVRVRMRGPRRDQDEVMALVRIGRQWKALPREIIEKLQTSPSKSLPLRVPDSILPNVVPVPAPDDRAEKSRVKQRSQGRS